MRSEVLSMLVALANVLGAGMIVPQVVRIYRYGDLAGVSGTWVGIGVALNLWWVAYAVQVQLWGLLPVSVMSAILYSLVALQVARSGDARTRRAMDGGALVAILVPLPSLLFGGWVAAGLVVGLSYAVQFSPAVLAAFRSTNLAGISPITWGMALVEAAIWATYGIALGDPALIVGGFGGGLMSLILLGRIGYLRTVKEQPSPELLVQRAELDLEASISSKATR